MSVYIIDYGMGNLYSVTHAFEKCGANVRIAKRPEEVLDATHIVLPGVGAFRDGMRNLHNNQWVKFLDEIVKEENIPILGICLGMQLLASKGYEIEETDGLGYIPGEVVLMRADNNERIPHVGWNDVYQESNSDLFSGIKQGTDFYFVHSFQFVPESERYILAKTPYAGGFVSVVQNKLVFGTQFHPEKSQKPGFKLIKNFLSI